jgi:hypothetical protein
MSTPETLTRELTALDGALAGRPVEPDLADLAELAVALRDDRPAPDPAFARSLDTRAERGFPRVRSRGRRGIKWPHVSGPALGLAASVLLVVVVAVSVPKGGDDSGSSGGGGVATTEQAPAGDASGACVPSSPADVSAAKSLPTAPRRD